VIDSRAKSRVTKEQSDTPQARGQTHASLFEETSRGKIKPSSRKSRKLTPAQLRELEEQKERDVLRGYHRVEELWPRLLDENDPGQLEAEREWMFEAEKLVDMFRETRMLFLTSRVCRLHVVL
jgi:general transcription factor 3C polypeptide 3 (transcription factor C subunit 4)